ncbi:MAG: hypothetical protein SFV19_04295, partial [Rhodospirillaceae bacterium]|nr:hypothetical protein [Rhodospirillaceae bacterium]
IAGRSWEAAARGARKPWLWLALGGVAVGAAAGLKLPTVIFCVGLCGAFLFVGPGGWVRVARSFVFGLGVLVGIGLFAGHWMVFLWDSFGNPIFPYFNELFGSSMGLAQDYRDTRFVPDNWLAAIFYPVFFAFDAEKVGEVAFRDFRILLAYTTLALLPMLWVAARGRIADRVELLRDGAAYVLIAVWLSYAVWLALFGIYRYLIPAEFIAPLLIVLTLALWPIPARVWRIASAGVLAFVTVSAWPATWGRVPWGDKFVEVTAPVIERPERAMVLLAGFSPTAWVIPAFPREASFLRIVGFGIEPAHGDTGINRQIRERIVSHDGDFYVLALEPERAYAAEVLSTFGLTLDADNCRPTPTNFGPGPELCAVSRLPDQASQESDNV